MSSYSRGALCKVGLGALLALFLVSNSFGQCEGPNVALMEASYPENKQFLFAIEDLSNGSHDTYQVDWGSGIIELADTSTPLANAAWDTGFTVGIYLAISPDSYGDSNTIVFAGIPPLTNTSSISTNIGIFSREQKVDFFQNGIEDIKFKAIIRYSECATLSSFWQVQLALNMSFFALNQVNQSLAATASLQTGSRSTFAALSSPTGRGTTTTSLGGTMPKLGPTPSPTPPQGYDQCDVEAGEGDGMCMGWVPGDPCGEGPGNTCLCTIGGNTVGGGNTCADGSYACSLVKPCSTDPNAPACPSGFVCVSKDAHCCNVTYDICVPGCGLPS